MCDCYGHKCEMCNMLVPMHIGDFKFPREKFKVWCKHHANKAPKDAIRFTARGFRCAILGPEVGGDGDNHPNILGWKETCLLRGGER
jgi:hypothetical protein